MKEESQEAQNGRKHSSRFRKGVLPQIMLAFYRRDGTVISRQMGAVMTFPEVVLASEVGGTHDLGPKIDASRGGMSNVPPEESQSISRTRFV